jgi:hypothetical protein
MSLLVCGSKPQVGEIERDQRGGTCAACGHRLLSVPTLRLLVDSLLLPLMMYDLPCGIAVLLCHVVPQDAHEFLNWLLNDISEALEKEGRSAARRVSRDCSRSSSRASSRGASPTKARSPTKAATGAAMNARSPSLQLLSQAATKAAAARNRPVRTWVHDLFQGKLVNETRCLQCETGEALPRLCMAETCLLAAASLCDSCLCRSLGSLVWVHKGQSAA